MLYQNICGIYKITSPTNKIYIGQSYNIRGRYIRYKKLSCIKQSRLYNSLKKYGWKSHKFEVLEEALKEELNELEIKYINKYNSTDRNFGLNLNSGGFNGNHSEETKDKMRQKAIGRKASLETRKKMSLAGKGRKKSEAWKRKIGLLSKNRVEVYTKIGKTVVKFKSMTDAGKISSYSRTMIGKLVKQGTKDSRYGYIWKKVE